MSTIAEKKVKPLPMKDLKEPSSPSYVPIPYPKTDEEVIVDFKYAVKKLYASKPGEFDVTVGPKPTSKIILPNLLEKNPIYTIFKIVKVKNRSARRAFDYTWLIIIVDQDGESVARVVIDANGLWAGTLCPPPTRKSNPIRNGEDGVKTLSKVLGKNISKKNVKHIEPLALPQRLGTLFFPAYEIKLTDGLVYYYNSSEDKIYRIIKEIPWEKNKKGQRRFWRELVQSRDIVFRDTLNDKIVFFEELRKKEL
jgi:hypothetical protein